MLFSNIENFTWNSLQNSLITRRATHSLQKSLAICCKIHKLVIAENSRCKNLSQLFAKFPLKYET